MKRLCSSIGEWRCLEKRRRVWWENSSNVLYWNWIYQSRHTWRINSKAANKYCSRGTVTKNKRKHFILKSVYCWRLQAGVAGKIWLKLGALATNQAKNCAPSRRRVDYACYCMDVGTYFVRAPSCTDEDTSGLTFPLSVACRSRLTFAAMFLHFSYCDVIASKVVSVYWRRSSSLASLLRERKIGP